MDRRVQNLRRKLEQQGYKHYLSADSIDLVEKLYIDLNQLKNLKYGNNGHNALALSKENAELQKENLRLKSENENKFKVLYDHTRKLENEISDLKLINDRHLQKIQQLEDESRKKSERLHEFLEKNLHATIQITGAQPVNRLRNQSLEIDSLLPSSVNNKQQKHGRADIGKFNHNHVYVDLLKAAENQASSLQTKCDNYKRELENANALIASLQEQMKVKNLHSEKISKLLKNDHNEHLHPCSDHLVAHLTFEMEHLQRLNHQLEKRLKECLNSEKETNLHEHKHLVNQNKQLEITLADADRVAELLQKQKDELLLVADKEMNEAKEEIKRLFEIVEKFDNENVNLKLANENLTTEKNDCREALAFANSQLRSLEIVVKHLKEEKNENKRSLDFENQDIVDVPQNNLKNENHLINIIKCIENQRDFYKRQLESYLSRSQRDKPLDDQGSDKTNFISQWNALINLLEEERDIYKNECKILREGRLSLNLETNENEENNLDELKTKLNVANDKNKELNKTLVTLEKHVLEVNESVNNLSDEKNALQKLYDKVLAAHQQQKLKVSQVIIPSTIPENVAKLQAELHKTRADVQKRELELEVLRNKLKLATETQVTERKRLEMQISDLKALQTDMKGDKSGLQSKINVNEIEIFDLKEENKFLNLRIAELEKYLNEDKTRNEKLGQDLSEKTERALKDQENVLMRKVSERSMVDKKVKDLEEQIEQLQQTIRMRNREIESLQRSIKVLDSDKDKFLFDIDEKTERLIALENDLKDKNSSLKSLQSNSFNLKDQLDNMADEVVRKNREIAMLKHDLDRSKKDLDEERKINYEDNARNLRLQDEINVLTRDNQAFDRSLQTCEAEKDLLKREVQEYVNEVRRVEELLHVKEQERTDLLDQFRNLSATTNDLEFQNNNLESLANNSKRQLREKEVELSRSKELVSDLSEEVNKHLTREQSYEQQLISARRSIDDMKLDYEILVNDKEKLNRELMVLNELNTHLSKDKERFAREMRAKEEEIAKFDVAIIELRQKLDAVNIQKNAEKTAVKSLEKLLASHREKEYRTLLSNREQRDELALLKEKLRQTESKLNELSSELSNYKKRSEDLQKEVEKLKNQLTDSKFNREKLYQEVQRIRQLYPTYVVTTTVTETKTTNDNPFAPTKSNEKLVNENR